MGILDIFSKDPTKKWDKRGRFHPNLNLKKLSLNNIKIGYPWEKLEALGKPSNPSPLKEERFEFYSSGCSIEIRDGRIDCFNIAVGGEQYDNLIPVKLTVLCDDGKEITLNDKSKLSDLAPRIGTEINRESDEEEINLLFETEKANLEIDCSLDEKIKRIYIDKRGEEI